VELNDNKSHDVAQIVNVVDDPSVVNSSSELGDRPSDSARGTIR